MNRSPDDAADFAIESVRLSGGSMSEAARVAIREVAAGRLSPDDALPMLIAACQDRYSNLFKRFVEELDD